MSLNLPKVLYSVTLGARSSPVLEKRKDELVWMQRRKETEQRVWQCHKKHSKGGEGSTAQRGKSAVKQRTVRRTGKHSKRGG